MATFDELRKALADVCATHEGYGIDECIDYAVEMVDDALVELAALRTWKEQTMSLLKVLAGSGHKALRGGQFDCWFCGEQQFKYFAPGGILEAGWEHAPDCPITIAWRLLNQGTGEA